MNIHQFNRFDKEFAYCSEKNTLICIEDSFIRNPKFRSKLFWDNHFPSVKAKGEFPFDLSAKSENEILPRISSIELMVTHDCNLACNYCFLYPSGQIKKKRKHAMSWEIAKNAIDFFLEKSPKDKKWNLHFTGGEPLLNQNLIFKSMDYVIKKNKSSIDKRLITFTISTNGLCLDKKTFDQLCHFPVKIQLSLDAAPEYHDENRLSGIEFKKLEQAAKLLSQGELNINSSWTPGVSTITERVRYFESLNATHCTIYPVHYLRGHDNRKCLHKRDYDMLLNEYEDYTKYLIDKYENSIRPIFNPFLKNYGIISGNRSIGISCQHSGKNVITVDIDGSFYPCYRFVNLPEYKIGSIFEGLSKSRLCNYHSQVISCLINCESCWAWPLCRGGNLCNHACADRIHQLNEDVCYFMHGFSELSLAFYAEIVSRGIDIFSIFRKQPIAR